MSAHRSAADFPSTLMVARTAVCLYILFLHILLYANVIKSALRKRPLDSNSRCRTYSSNPIGFDRVSENNHLFADQIYVKLLFSISSSSIYMILLVYLITKGPCESVFFVAASIIFSSVSTIRIVSVVSFSSGSAIVLVVTQVRSSTCR